MLKHNTVYNMGRGKNVAPFTTDTTLHKVARKPGRGVQLNSHVIESVRVFFEEEKRCGRSILQERVIDRTAQATNISKSTIKNIHHNLTHDGHFLTPTKRYSASQIWINPDAFDREAIRRTVHSFYKK